MSGPIYVYDTVIGADADRIWAALTTAEFTQRYFYCTLIESDWNQGSPVVFRMADGSEAVEGTVLEANRPHRLSITWHPLYDPAMAEEPPSRVTFDIEELADSVCRLRVTHDEFIEDSVVHASVSQGWAAILCSLKTLLETGEPLPVAGNEPAEASA